MGQYRVVEPIIASFVIEGLSELKDDLKYLANKQQYDQILGPILQSYKNILPLNNVDRKIQRIFQNYVLHAGVLLRYDFNRKTLQ